MDNSKEACPVCTLFLREGVTLQAHLNTHPKDQVIEALLKVSKERSQASVETTSNNSDVPMQTQFNPTISAVSQTPQSLPQTVLEVYPPSQMTTAVTYQHFMTSNGASVMPQFIQVPAFLNSGNNISVSESAIPNQSLNYSQTTFNPLYNPYIPQPYPFTQPVYASFPVSTFPANGFNTQNKDSSDSTETIRPTPASVKTCNVETNKAKRKSKIVSKKPPVKYTSAYKKLKLLKQKVNNLSHTSGKNVNRIGVSKTSIIRSTSRETKTVSISTNSERMSPLPLISIGESTSTAGLTKMSANSRTPSPPPLAKASCCKLVDMNEGEDASDCAGTSAIIDCSKNNKRRNSSDLETVVVKSNFGNHTGSTEVEKHEEIEIFSIKCEINEIESVKPSLSVVKTNEAERTRKNEKKKAKGKKVQVINLEEEKQEEDSDKDEDVNSENGDKNWDSEMFLLQNNILFNDDFEKDKTSITIFPEYVDSQNSESNKINGNENHSQVIDVITKRADAHSLTYTDLQPVKSPRLFKDLGLGSYLNFSNYMEIDTYNALFDNNPDVQIDSITKITTVQPSLIKTDTKITDRAIVDSVIQIVSSNSEPKSETSFSEGYTATTSHSQVSDINLDLPDLSPFGLNIQTDESMPARGELSEQESLGAENTYWNQFYGNIYGGKALEKWKTERSQSVTVIGSKTLEKSFKCSICNESFSCPKERRVHKNTVHLKGMEKGSQTKKAKTFPCSFCSDVFNFLRDLKAHVVQNHFLEIKSKRALNGEVKQEVDTKVAITDPPVKNEAEKENVKTENSNIPPDTNQVMIKYCLRCRYPFWGMKKLREHLRLVHGEIRYKCDLCSACFDEVSEYNNHLLTHPLVCDKCGKTFHRKANLKLHMRRHLPVKPYKCSVCAKSFITLQKMKEHINTHSGKKPLKCSFCDKTFNRHSNLIQHRKMRHLSAKKNIKDFVCRCGEVFHSLKKLEWHKEVHEPKPKPCPYCSQKFIHTSSVTRHIRRAHLPDYLPGDNRESDNIQCPVCEKMYLRSSLSVHMRVHNGDKPFECKSCNKKFSTKWNLELHNFTHQSRSSLPFKCQLCKRAFFRELDLEEHMNGHKNLKPYTCNYCGQKFNRKYSCLRHQDEHVKHKQYVCAVSGCAKSFHRAYYLRDHMTVHTGFRPHTCHICGKSSSTKSNHNKHLRIHDSREPVNTES